MNDISIRTIIYYLRNVLSKDEMTEIELLFLDEDTFLMDKVKGVQVALNEMGLDLYEDSVDVLVDSLEEEMAEDCKQLINTMDKIICQHDMQEIPVFISSTFDAKKERKIILKQLEIHNRDTLSLVNAKLVLMDWDAFKKQFFDNVGSSSGHYRKNNTASGAFIGLLGPSLSLESEKLFYTAKTEIEFALKYRESLKILMYHKNETSTILPEVLDQQYALGELTKEVLHSGIQSIEFKKPKFFKKGKRFLIDLIEMTLQVTKDFIRRKNLKAFFQFKTSQGRQPSVGIGYPAIHSQDFLFSGQKLELNWHTRLLPPIVFEDSKTIFKLVNAIVEIGNIRYSTSTIGQLNLNDKHGNRIELCLPRNERAQKELKALDDRPRFRFDNKLKLIHWKNNNETEVIIPSPLDKYLSEQRDLQKAKTSQSQNLATDSKPEFEWHSGYGRIICRDYAIISRFKVYTNEIDQDEYFYHYYIAGIRGLGTWGAGCYIDRFPEKLAKLVEEQGEENVQTILEITYEDYHITDVKDVSHCDQNYFYKRISDTFIKSEIDRFTKKYGESFKEQDIEILLDCPTL